MYSDIINHFPPASQNNSRTIVRKLIEQFTKKPNYGLEVKLSRLGIGVDHTTEGRPESLHLTETIEFTSDPNEPF